MVTVLRIPILDTPTPADDAMLQVADCASANLLMVWIIDAISPIRACSYSRRIPWSHFLLNLAYKAYPSKRVTTYIAWDGRYSVVSTNRLV